MKNTLFAASLAATSLLGTSVLAATVLETAIGNTVATTQDGVEIRYYFNDNGSVSLANSNGESDVGTWSTDSGELCMSWTSADAPACMPISDQQVSVGDTVTLTGTDGTSIDITIMAGKVPF